MLDQIFSVVFLTGFLAATLRMATPILITALGEMIAERSGVLNLGIEGIIGSWGFLSAFGYHTKVAISGRVSCGED